jgi:hypothetical protein
LREARGYFTRFASDDDLSDEKFFSKSRSKKAAAVGPNPYKEPFAIPAHRSRSTSTGRSRVAANNNNARNSTPQLPSDEPNLDAAKQIDSDYWLKQAAEEAAPMFSFKPL